MEGGVASESQELPAGRPADSPRPVPRRDSLSQPIPPPPAPAPVGENWEEKGGGRELGAESEIKGTR